MSSTCKSRFKKWWRNWESASIGEDSKVSQFTSTRLLNSRNLKILNLRSVFMTSILKKPIWPRSGKLRRKRGILMILGMMTLSWTSMRSIKRVLRNWSTGNRAQKRAKSHPVRVLKNTCWRQLELSQDSKKKRPSTPVRSSMDLNQLREKQMLCSKSKSKTDLGLHHNLLSKSIAMDRKICLFLMIRLWLNSWSKRIKTKLINSKLSWTKLGMLTQGAFQKKSSFSPNLIPGSCQLSTLA